MCSASGLPSVIEIKFWVACEITALHVQVEEPAAGEKAGAASDLPEPPALRKDANDVLMQDGPEALHELVLAAKPYPSEDAAAR